MELLARLADARRLADRANILLPGLYAWLITIGQPATSAGASALARVLSLLSLIALVLGPLLAFERATLARVIGIYAFTALSVLAWWQLGPAIAPDRLDPVRGALGAAGWLLYAFGWGKMRARGDVPERDPNVLDGAPLPARARVPWAAWVVAALAAAGALIPVLLAWRVDRPDHAILAHAVALAAGVTVLSAGASLALGFGQTHAPRSPSARLNSAAPALAVLAVLAVAGLMWLVLS